MKDYTGSKIFHDNILEQEKPFIEKAFSKNPPSVKVHQVLDESAAIAIRSTHV